LGGEWGNGGNRKMENGMLKVEIPGTEKWRGFYQHVLEKLNHIKFGLITQEKGCRRKGVRV
jgi:hypothetical protein